MRNAKVRWLLVIISIFILSASTFNRRYKDVNADDATTEVKPYKTPSGNAAYFIGFRTRSGYIQQPAKDTYIEINKTKNIYADARRSVGDQLLGAALTSRNYQWYESSDGQNWSKVDKKAGGTKKNLPLTPNTVGTKYYQLETYWSDLFGLVKGFYLYSDVAAVHCVHGPTDATDGSVTTDDDYLYNSSNDLVNTDTYARAIPIPEYFTGYVTWSVDNTNLATIDSETGLLEANTKRISGVVKVIGTFHNPSGSTFERETTVTIGEGLEDQTVHAGETATFKFMGNIGELDEDDETSYTVKWYKEDPITHVRTQVQKDSPKALSYSIPDTTLDDDGMIVLAIISIKYNGKTYSYTTNEALLHVIPNGGPDLSFTNTLSNETYNDGTNTDNSLYGVINGDTVKYKDKVTNQSTSGTLKNGIYTMPLRKGTTVSNVLVDGQSTTNYQVADDDQTGNTNVTIPGLDFKINQSHTIEIDTKVNGIVSRTSYSSVPYVTGTNDSNEDYRAFGQTDILNYTTDTAVIENVQDIDYGNVESYGRAKLLSRANPDSSYPNNGITIDDMRRYKDPIQLTVKQGQALVNSNGTQFAGELRYYNSSGYQTLGSQPAIITTTTANQPLDSMSWNANDGLLLYQFAGMKESGLYTGTVDWTITQSIQ